MRNNYIILSLTPETSRKIRDSENQKKEVLNLLQEIEREADSYLRELVNKSDLPGDSEYYPQGLTNDGQNLILETHSTDIQEKTAE